MSRTSFSTPSGMEPERDAPPSPAGRWRDVWQEEPAAHRVDMPCAAAGFDAPPCHLFLRMVRLGGRWVMWMRMPPGWPDRLKPWLLRYGPATVQVEEGIAPSMLRADFVDIPDAWKEIHEELHVRCIELTPEGTAALFTNDPVTKVRWFLDRRSHLAQIQMRNVQRGDPVGHLTPRQRDVLALAVAMGYYEVPRRLTLHELAERLGVSVGAASEIVRRGERMLITSTFDAMAESAWK